MCVFGKVKPKKGRGGESSFSVEGMEGTRTGDANRKRRYPTYQGPGIAKKRGGVGKNTVGGRRDPRNASKKTCCSTRSVKKKRRGVKEQKKRNEFPELQGKRQALTRRREKR